MVGVARVHHRAAVHGSDIGQLHNLPHSLMNRWMVKLLFAYGCTKEQLQAVFGDSPAALLGLEPPVRVVDPMAEASRLRALGYPQADPHARLRAHGIRVPSPSAETLA